MAVSQAFAQVISSLHQMSWHFDTLAAHTDTQLMSVRHFAECSLHASHIIHTPTKVYKQQTCVSYKVALSI